MFKTLRILIVCIVLVVLAQELGNCVRTLSTKSLFSPSEIGCTTDMECFQMTGVNY